MILFSLSELRTRHRASATARCPSSRRLARLSYCSSSAEIAAFENADQRYSAAITRLRAR